MHRANFTILLIDSLFSRPYAILSSSFQYSVKSVFVQMSFDASRDPFPSCFGPKRSNGTKDALYFASYVAYGITLSVFIERLDRYDTEIKSHGDCAHGTNSEAHTPREITLSVPASDCCNTRFCQTVHHHRSPASSQCRQLRLAAAQWFGARLLFFPQE